MTIDLSKAIGMAQGERDNAATTGERKAFNTAANMLKRAQAGKPVFKSQQRYLPVWCVEQVIEMDIEQAIRQASVAVAE